MLEHLKTMRELLSKKSRWTQGECARDKNGVSVRPTNEEACSWCLIGATWKVTKDVKAFDKV